MRLPVVEEFFQRRERSFGEDNLVMHAFGEFLGEDSAVQFPHPILQLLYLAVLHTQGELNHFYIGLGTGQVNGFFGGIAIGPGQPTRTQLDAAKVAHHHCEYVDQIARVEQLEDRFAGSAAGFCGIVKTRRETLWREDTKRPCDMRRVRIFLMQGGESGTRFWFGGTDVHIADETRFINNFFIALVAVNGKHLGVEIDEYIVDEPRFTEPRGGCDEQFAVVAMGWF